jgi:hypothetical protein
MRRLGSASSIRLLAGTKWQCLKWIALVTSLLLIIFCMVSWTRRLLVNDYIGYRHFADNNDDITTTHWELLSAGIFIMVCRSAQVPSSEVGKARLLSIKRNSASGFTFGPAGGERPSWARFREGLTRFGFDTGVDRSPDVSRIWSSFELPHWVVLFVVSSPMLLESICAVRRVRRSCPAPLNCPQTEQ